MRGWGSQPMLCGGWGGRQEFCGPGSEPAMCPLPPRPAQCLPETVGGGGVSVPLSVPHPTPRDHRGLPGTVEPGGREHHGACGASSQERCPLTAARGQTVNAPHFLAARGPGWKQSPFYSEEATRSAPQAPQSVGVDSSQRQGFGGEEGGRVENVE